MVVLAPSSYYATEQRILYLRPLYLVDPLSFVLEAWVNTNAPNAIGPYSFRPGTEVVAYAQCGAQPTFPRPVSRIFFLRHENIEGYTDGVASLLPRPSLWHPDQIAGYSPDWRTDSAVNPRSLTAGQPSAEPDADFVCDPAFIENEQKRSLLHFRAWSAWRAYHGVPEPTELTSYFFGAYARYPG